MAAISSYSTLKTAVADFLARSDLTSYLAYFIEAGEERIYRELKCRQMETAVSSAISSGVIALPSGFRGFKTLYIDGSPITPLRPMDLDSLYREFTTRSSDGEPIAYAINGGNVEFGPYPDSAYTVKGTYWKKLDALSDSNTSNWLITDAPYMLLWAALVESEPFNKNDERIPVWERKYVEAREGLKTEQRNEGGSGLSMRAA